MNSTPAASSARRTAASLAAVIEVALSAKLGPADGGDPDRRILGQILGAPAQKGPRSADLGAGQGGMGALFHVDAHGII